jgi:hypothetical protein
LTGHLSGALSSTGTANSLTKTRNSNDQAVDCDLMMKAYTGSQAVDSTATFFVQPNMKIQGAIDAAWKDETVNVAAGTYTENVVLNKPLTLVGAGRGDDQAFNTIIQAYLKDQPIIKITSGDTTVKNLQVTGANVYANQNVGSGIKIAGSKDINNVVLENVASNNNFYGLDIESDGFDISDVNANGIKITGSGGSDVYLYANGAGSSISGMSMNGAQISGGYIGVEARAFTDGSISGLNLNNAQISGSEWNGVYAWADTDGTISGMSLDNAKIAGSGANGVSLLANGAGTISDMSMNGAQISGSGANGVLLFANGAGSSISDISMNGAQISGSGANGVQLFAYGSGSSISDISMNGAQISGSGLNGVFAQAAGACSISDVRMIGGKIKLNDKFGLQIADGDVSNVVFNNVNIYGNSLGGVSNTGYHNIDARFNYWGAPNAPSGGVADPITTRLANGGGDSVSSGVWFDPWSTVIYA